MPHEPEMLIRQELKDQFSDAIKNDRIIFFSAPCGCGKTMTSKALLEELSITYIECQAADMSIPDKFGKNEVLLIDDFQLIDENIRAELERLIKKETRLKIVILSRGIVPGWLMPYKMTGVLHLFRTQDLFFDRKTTKEFLENAGIFTEPAELIAIFKDMSGYPIAMSILLQYMKGGKNYDHKILGEVKQELFRYFDEMVFNRFDENVRSMLLSLAPFDSINIELAKMVSGDSNAGEIINYLLCDTTMFRNDYVEEYELFDIFKEYLLWKMKYTLCDSEIHEIYARGGLYYELQNDRVRALEYYSRADEIHRVSALLVKNAGEHPGAANYLELEKYYNMLPEDEVIKSPALMCALSMLNALCMNYDESEIWYSRLQNFAISLKKTDTEYKEAVFRLAYLNVALPQRGTHGLKDILLSIFKMMANGDIKAPGWSATSSLPSTMNGSKDFCEWSRQDDLLYATVKMPVEAVLGSNGVGLGDAGLCESKFEKGQNISRPMLTLMSKLGEIQAKGTPDMEFAVIGLIARAQVAEGKPEDALSTLTNIRKKFSDEKFRRFWGNIDAMIARVHVLLGNTGDARDWLESDAPKDDVRVWVLWRYQYITKGIVHLALGEEVQALIDVARLIPYCEHCERTMDTVYINIIMAIAHYRMKDELWDAELCRVLDICMEYHFVQPVAQYGAAILPLMNDTAWNKNDKFKAQLINAARKHAVFYPRFMKQEKEITETLSDAELDVLKLICRDMSNNDIGDILGIKLPTVKTHVSHILQKLQVERRSEARAKAEKMHLI